MIDLHVHTNFSDGSYSPRDVVRRAVKRGLKAIAITDHDTIEGLSEAVAESELHGLEILTGLEISAESGKGNIHILGYMIDLDNAALLENLEFLRIGRRERIPKILKKLQSFDMPITIEEIEREAPGGVPGRPHVANVMFYKQYVKSRPEAFDKFLRRGAPAFEDKVKLSLAKAIEIIRGAGGIPVLAHPVSLDEHDSDKLFDRLEELKKLGLMGIEAYYSTHSEKQTELYLEIADELDLCVTGGSDFHGIAKPTIEIGKIPVGGPLPYILINRLKELATNGLGRQKNSNEKQKN